MPGCFPYVRRHVPDRFVYLVEQPGKVPCDALNQELFYPLPDLVEDIQHRLSPALTKQVRQQGDKLHTDQRNAAARHELLHAL